MEAQIKDTMPDATTQMLDVLLSIKQALLKEKNPYMTVADIADEFGVSASTVRNEYIVAPSFPKKYYFVTKADGSGKSRPYYKRSEVYAYLDRVNK